MYDLNLLLDVAQLKQVPWEEMSKNRIRKSLQAVSKGATTPVKIAVGEWGSDSEAWIGRVEEKNGELFLQNKSLQTRFEESLQEHKLVVAVAAHDNLVDHIRESAWDNYVSVTTVIVGHSLREDTRPCSLAVFDSDKIKPQTIGSHYVLVTLNETAIKTHITLGPSGDYVCPVELFEETGYKIS
jgi:hypothetical protein